MSNIYTDYVNKIAITVPERYIDVKTGESHLVAAKIVEQIEYHANNNTLSHLVLSALQQYLSPKPVLTGGSAEILQQLADIKSILGQKGMNIQPNYYSKTQRGQPDGAKKINIKEVEDILEAFGG